MFNSTNNKDTLANTIKATQPMVSITNVGKKETTSCGKMPGLIERTWLDKLSMITIISFAELANRHKIQCNNPNGESFQVHTEVGMMKFKRSEEGLHDCKFSPEFIESMQEQHAQCLGTVEENATGHTK